MKREFIRKLRGVGVSLGVSIALATTASGGMYTAFAEEETTNPELLEEEEGELPEAPAAPVEEEPEAPAAEEPEEMPVEPEIPQKMPELVLEHKKTVQVKKPQILLTARRKNYEG